MHYLDPFTALGLSPQTPLDPRAIQRGRKKLLTDLELGGDESLDINGASFTKNDLIKYFDELEKENVAGYHAAISEDPALLRFLQTGAIENEATFKQAPLYGDPGFIHWLSPYFYAAFTKGVNNSFDQRNAAAMRAILNNPLLMTGEDTEKAWQLITDILERNIALFDHYRTRGQKNSPKPMPISKVGAYLSYDYVQVIKQLPDDRFARLKDRYALNMQHPAISTFNRDPGKRPIATGWIENALDLTVSPTAIETVQAKLDEFHRLLKKKRRRNIVRMVYVVFVLVGMSTAFFQTNNDQPNIAPVPTLTPLPANITRRFNSTARDTTPRLDSTSIPIVRPPKKHRP